MILRLTYEDLGRPTAPGVYRQENGVTTELDEDIFSDWKYVGFRGFVLAKVPSPNCATPNRNASAILVTSA